jgi:hypothetical protein
VVPKPTAIIPEPCKISTTSAHKYTRIIKTACNGFVTKGKVDGHAKDEKRGRSGSSERKRRGKIKYDQEGVCWEGVGVGVERLIQLIAPGAD